MSCSLRARIFIVALCFISFAAVFVFPLAGELSGQFTSRVLRAPPQCIDLPNRDAPAETDDYTSVLLRAILDAPHSREWFVKAVVHWLTLCQWFVVGMIALRFRHVEQSDLARLFTPDTITQHLSCFALRLLCAARERVMSLVPVSLTPVLVTVSSTGLQLSPMNEMRFRNHTRSPSRVAEIAL